MASPQNDATAPFDAESVPEVLSPDEDFSLPIEALDHPLFSAPEDEGGYTGSRIPFDPAETKEPPPPLPYSHSGDPLSPHIPVGGSSLHEVSAAMADATGVTDQHIPIERTLTLPDVKPPNVRRRRLTKLALCQIARYLSHGLPTELVCATYGMTPTQLANLRKWKTYKTIEQQVSHDASVKMLEASATIMRSLPEAVQKIVEDGLQSTDKKFAVNQAWKIYDTVKEAMAPDPQTNPNLPGGLEHRLDDRTTKVLEQGFEKMSEISTALAACVTTPAGTNGMDRSLRTGPDAFPKVEDTGTTQTRPPVETQHPEVAPELGAPTGTPEPIS